MFAGLGPLILRVALGIIFLVHGWFKLQPTRGALKTSFMSHQGTGWELDFAVLAALSLVFTGAGALAPVRVLGL